MVLTVEPAWPRGASGALSLSFDDARPSQLDLGVPLFEEIGVRVTFFLLPQFRERVGDWAEVSRAGHEIGSHTARHPCSGNFGWVGRAALEDMTLDDIDAEIRAGDASIRAGLDLDPGVFAYPCGQTFVGRGTGVVSYVPLVARRFDVGRGYLDETANDPARCDLAQVAAMAADGVTAAVLVDSVHEAARSGRWLVLAGHDIAPPGATGTRPDTIRRVVDEARSRGLWIDTIGAVGGHVRQARARAG